MHQHDFFKLMSGVRESLERDYQRIRRRSISDPGTAGDQAEEDWAEVLRGWLPASYPIITKGRILYPDGTSSPQVDVLILKPSYPQKLRHEKYLFSGGVIAAFECKLTLRKSDIDRAFKTAKEIKKKAKDRIGTPYDELNSPPIYGLLAHSQSLGGERKPEKPSWRLHSIIEEVQTRHAEHPRELLDIVCVADSATLPLGKFLLLGRGLSTEEIEELGEASMDGLISTMYTIHDEDRPLDSVGAILAGLIHELTYRIAFEDAAIQDWADHLSHLGSYGGIGRPVYWTHDELSDGVREILRTAGRHEDRWSKWCKYLP